ncbi:hypothetical protein J6590_092621 [Homalodisca vitripennis]|nr:hypothetical protein J6590_092621 [Homalodisca vitripennis]
MSHNKTVLVKTALASEVAGYSGWAWLRVEFNEEEKRTLYLNHVNLEGPSIVTGRPNSTPASPVKAASYSTPSLVLG